MATPPNKPFKTELLGDGTIQNSTVSAEGFNSRTMQESDFETWGIDQTQCLKTLEKNMHKDIQAFWFFGDYFPKENLRPAQVWLGCIGGQLTSSNEVSKTLGTLQHNNSGSRTDHFYPLITKEETESLSNTSSTSSTFGISSSISISSVIGTAKVGGETSVSYEQSWGKSETQTKTNLIGMSSKADIEVPAGYTAIATYTVKNVTLKAQVLYFLSLNFQYLIFQSGDYIYKTLASAAFSNGLPEHKEITDEITFSFFVDGVLTHTDHPNTETAGEQTIKPMHQYSERLGPISEMKS